MMLEIIRTDSSFVKNRILRSAREAPFRPGTADVEHRMKLNDLGFSTKYVREKEKLVGKEGNKRY
jgi:hypothetical protein